MLPPSLVPAEVKRPAERALEATTEAPVSTEAPLVNAIGVPLDAERGVSEPERVRIVEPPLVGADPSRPRVPDVESPFTVPCCGATPEHPHLDPPHLLTGVKAISRDESALEASAQAATPVETPPVNAIGIPLEERPGVSDPVYVPVRASQLPAPDVLSPCCTVSRRRDNPAPVTVDAPWRRLDAHRANAKVIVTVLVLLLAIGFWLSRRRRKPRLEQEPFPKRRPLQPDELPRPDVAPLPQPEPEVAAAIARATEAEQELESA
jgi:hypothetical protein